MPDATGVSDVSGESEVEDTPPGSVSGSATHNVSRHTTYATPSGSEGGPVAAPVVKTNGKKKMVMAL